jgi:uncharacterized membrane protein
MAQVPPPPPPGAGAPPTATGGSMDKKTSVILAYLLWWVTGIIFLFIAKGDPDIKWNAAQSVVVLGGLWLISVILLAIVAPIGYLFYAVGVVYWAIFLYKAVNYQGGRIEAPLIGQYTNQITDQLANAIP